MPENTTPVYCLDNFSRQAGDNSFYIEMLAAHLRNHSFVNDPHKHDFYLILYVTRGGGEHTIDFKTYKVSPGSLFVMTPGQVHSWKLEPGTDGFIIFFNHEFQEFPSNPHITPKDAGTLDVIIKEMYKEVDTKIRRGWLELLLLKLSTYYQENGTVNATTFRLRKLEQLIDKNFMKLKKPADYANLMHLSPAYLNNLCKKHLGKTLSDLINGRIVLEGKRLFAYTDLNVAQVSNKLRFSEPSYFIRFFKKNAGITPEQFKESAIRAIQ
jgi:AraC family transcriptional activator of pobA